MPAFDPSAHERGGDPANTGRFSVAARAEGDVLDLVDGAGHGLPDWEPPAGTDTPRGSFDRCKATSAAYTNHLRSHGVAADWVQVCGRRGYLPDVDPRWRTIEQTFWQHYVTRVPGPDGDLYVDWTARQFDPNADHPQITRADSPDWEEEYTVTSALSAYGVRHAPTPQPATPVVPLPPGRMAIIDYFTEGGVSDYVKTPWVRSDVHITLVPSDWKKLPTREVPLAGLRRTQSRLIKDHVRRHLDTDAKPDGDDLPWLVRFRGTWWVVDGHHRCVAGMFRGEKTITGHYIDLDDR